MVHPGSSRQPIFEAITDPRVLQDRILTLNKYCDDAVKSHMAVLIEYVSDLLQPWPQPERLTLRRCSLSPQKSKASVVPSSVAV